MKEVINIYVNDVKVVLEKDTVSGAELKKAAGIPESVMLALKVDGGADTEIANKGTYSVKSGMRFYSELYKEEIIINIDYKEYKLQKSECTGLELKNIGSVPIELKLVKETKDGIDERIENNVVYHIENKDVFFSVPSGINNGTEGTGLLPFDHKVLEDEGYEYEVRQNADGKLLIIEGFPLSPMFDQEKVRVLVKIPNGYPMAPLDMFWIQPYVKLKATNNYPQNADVFENISNERWQRFSRHYGWKTTYNLRTHLGVIKEVLVNGRG